MDSSDNLQEEKKIDIWMIINSIFNKKPYEWHEIEKIYNPWIINRAMSHYKDCVEFANDMNKHYFLSKEVQYLYYINSIRPGSKKGEKWGKVDKTHEENLKLVRAYFGYNIRKAEEALQVLTPGQIEMIKQKQETGGIK